MLNTPFLSFVFVALTLISSITDARRLYRRECGFTWPAIDGDTCATMAQDWAMYEDIFRAINPRVSCSQFVSGKEFCVEWVGPKPSVPVVTLAPGLTAPPSTILVTETSSARPSKPAVPSPYRMESLRTVSLAELKLASIVSTLTQQLHRSDMVPRQRRRYLPKDSRLL